MSEISVTKENVWQYYEKLSDWEARCRFCAHKFVYIDIRNFRFKYLRNEHKKIFEYEEVPERQEWPWIFFKYVYPSNTFDESRLYSKCLVCDEVLTSDFLTLVNHLRGHPSNKVKEKKIEDYIHHSWIWKYCTKIDDFRVKSNIFRDKEPQEYIFNLNSYLNYHTATAHLDELRNAEETHDIVLSSESVAKLKVTEVKENMSEYYEKSHLKVICKFCKYSWTYMYSVDQNLLRHIKQEHKKIFEWEQTHVNEKRRWTYYFQLIFDQNIIYAKCLICRDLFPFESVEGHLNNHSEEDKAYFVTNVLSDHWMFKYYNQSGDSDNKMKCDICYKEISFMMHCTVFNHTIERHSEKLQLNISRKKMQKLWQNFIDLGNFRAGCQFCNFQSYYINTTNFSGHVKKEHIDIYNYEERCGDRWPFKYFTYIDSITLQCWLCNVNYPFKYEYDLIIHLTNEHFSVKPDHIIDYGWIWKYCEKVGDFEVECSLCKSKIYLVIPLWYLDRHIEAEHPNRPTNTQETYDIAGPSGSNDTKKTGFFRAWE